MDRRRFLLTTLAGVLAAPLVAEAGKVYRVGVLSPEVPPPGFLDAFREGLRDFGHVDGQNISLELGTREGRTSSFLIWPASSSRLMWT